MAAASVLADTSFLISLVSRRDWIEKGQQVNRILIHLDPLVGTVTVQ